MRIPKGFSDELRNQADIVKIVGDYVSLKKKGNNFWACCPFHGEKTPSFSVNANKGFFKCFGCGKAGDVFRFVMEIEGASFPEAVQTVAEKAGVSLPVFEESREFEERDRFRAELQQLNQWAVEFFEQSLTETGEGRRGLAYLEQRGVQEATRKLFKLGYAPNSWDALTGYLKGKGATVTQIERSGLVSLKETGGSYDKFRGRLMFPICDAQGRVVAFGGRILGEGEPKYLNSPETALYTKGQHLFGLSHARDAIRQRGFAILVEGYLDFLIPYQAGVKNLVASLGTALTEQQVRLLGRYAQKIIVNFDPDAAGVNATNRSLELLLGQGFKVNVLTLPDNLDPDEFIRARGAESYNQLLKTSQSFLDYIVEQAVGAHDQTRPVGKIETVNAILPYLRLVNDKLERSEQIVRIADRLRIDSKLLREEFKKAAETKQERVSERALRETIALKSAERKLLEVLLNRAPLRRRLLQQLREEDFAGLRTERLFRLIFEFEQKNIELNYAEITHVLLEGADTDEALAREILPRLWTLEEAETDPNDLTALKVWWGEAAASLHSLRYERLAEKRAVVKMEMNQAQRANDTQRINELTALNYELAKREQALANWSPSEA